jgi:hypothetical protein
MFRGRQKGWTWRAVVAGIAAYALALNVIFAGSLGGTIAIAGDDPGGFEICLGHIGASDQQAPALPDTGKLHCVLCVAGIDAPVLPAKVTRHLVRNSAIEAGLGLAILAIVGALGTLPPELTEEHHMHSHAH